MIENNYLELVDVESIEYVDEYENMVDIAIDIDESFSLSNGIISHNSANSTAVEGFGVLGREHHGAYPLKGKVLNVRDAALTKVRDNAEIKNIISALGLEFGRKYKSTKDLRYGKVVIMTDADCIDGNAFVLTKRGHILIKDLTYEDEVLTHNNRWQSILNIIKTSKKKSVDLKIGGEFFSFGINHKIPILNNGLVKLICAKDIKKTDKILIKKKV